MNRSRHGVAETAAQGTPGVCLGTRPASRLATLIAGSALVLLGACAPGAPPEQRGLFGGFGAMASGEDLRRQNEFDNHAAAREREAMQARRDAQEAEARRERSEVDLDDAEARLDMLQRDLMRQRAELDRLVAARGAAQSREAARIRRQMDALERDRQVAVRRVGGPPPAELRQLEQDSREIFRSLERFAKI